MAKQKYYIVIYFLVLLLFSSTLFAQEEEPIIIEPVDSLELENQKINRHAGASLILPGFGQYLNKEYKKIPVIYAVGAATMYIGISNNKKFKEYDQLSNDLLKISPYNPEYLKLQPEYLSAVNSASIYKRNRNLGYLASGIWYAYNVVDAVYNTDSKTHSPAKATLMSTLIPGAGQVYNKAYWKIPIIYGLLATCTYAVQFNNENYGIWRQAYSDFIDIDEDTQSYLDIPGFNATASNATTVLKNYKDYYRRNRDYSVIIGVAVYVANILDATVDAHLFDYEITEDVAFDIQPTILYAGNGRDAFGYSLKITF